MLLRTTILFYYNIVSYKAEYQPSVTLFCTRFVGFVIVYERDKFSISAVVFEETRILFLAAGELEKFSLESFGFLN